MCVAATAATGCSSRRGASGWKNRQVQCLAALSHARAPVCWMRLRRAAAVCGCPLARPYGRRQAGVVHKCVLRISGWTGSAPSARGCLTARPGPSARRPALSAPKSCVIGGDAGPGALMCAAPRAAGAHTACQQRWQGPLLFAHARWHVLRAAGALRATLGGTGHG